MASIVQRNKSFSVVYTIYDGDKKKQKWETYHSYEAALRRKEQLDLIQQHEKERAQYHEGTLWLSFLKNMWNCTAASTGPVPPTPATKGSFGTILFRLWEACGCQSSAPR